MEARLHSFATDKLQDSTYRARMEPKRDNTLRSSSVTPSRCEAFLGDLRESSHRIAAPHHSFIVHNLSPSLTRCLLELMLFHLFAHFGSSLRASVPAHF